jgi:hypothetical protein
MSTDNECLFFQWEEGKWYYLLEDYNAPKNSWDWRDHAASYGPFSTEEKAHEDLHQNHANPSGHTLSPNPEKEDPVLIEHVKNATVIKRNSFYRW